MATLLEDINAALREIGVLATSETAAAADALDAMAAANRLLDQWRAERLQFYALTRTTWTIVSGTQDYNVGTGLTVNVVRPVYIDHINFQDTSQNPVTEYPMVALTDDAYASIVEKGLTSTLPQSWYYNQTQTYGVVSLFPIPTSGTLQGVMYAPTAITAFTSLTNTIAMPPGYEELLITGLAVNLASSYSAQISPSLAQRAINARAIVKRSNIRMRDLSFDPAALIGNRGYGWDIRSGP
jgi:hypothetical protein